jgi:hypothetical protein
VKTIHLAVAMSGMFIPALASAELNYNAVDAGYSTTSYRSDISALTELELGFSRSISGNAYLGASCGSSSQTMDTTLGDNKVHSISLSAGYHVPLMDNVDALANGHIIRGSAKLAGISTSTNGSDIGAGVRAQFIHGLEGTLEVVHASTSDGTISSTHTFIKTEVGYNILPKFQMTAGVDLKPDHRSYLGVRFFY